MHLILLDGGKMGFPEEETLELSIRGGQVSCREGATLIEAKLQL